MSIPPRRRGRREPSLEERRRILAEAAAQKTLEDPPPLGAIAAGITGVLVAGGFIVWSLSQNIQFVDRRPYPLGVFCGVVFAVLYSLVVSNVLERFGELRTPGTVALRGVVVVLAAVAGSLAATGALTMMNVRLDTNAGDIHPALVLDRIPAAGGHGTARLEWDPGVEKSIRVPPTLLGQIQPGRSILHVRTNPGRFGWAWIDGVAEVVELPPPAAPVSPAAADPSLFEARALVDEAQTMLRDGQRDEAIAAVKRSIQLDPRNVHAYTTLDSLLTADKDFDTLVDYWSRLIDVDPENREAWFARATARRAANDAFNAADDAEQACQLGHPGGCQIAAAMRSAEPR